MRFKLLLFFLSFGLKTIAQTNSTEAVAPGVLPDNSLEVAIDSAVKVNCSDTVRWGNFYVADLAGSRLAMNSLLYERERLIVGGRYYGRVIGYRTLNGRFLIETGYLIRRINNVNRIPTNSEFRDLIIYTNTRQIPLYLKTRIFGKPHNKFQMRLITGLNYTVVNSEEYGIRGDLKVILKEPNKITLQEPRPTWTEENYFVSRTINTSNSGSNKHLTAEIGLEWSYPLSRKFEIGGGITYQYRSKPFEEIKIDYIYTYSNPAGPVIGGRTSGSMGPYKDDPSLNCAIFVRYNFDKMTSVKCPKAKSNN